ncbi:MAG TPA: hypothetical protein VFQ34_13245 [Nitrospiraceae bacterium]|nr:hypothetical protein [Nitrospiraceae bacterium]
MRRAKILALTMVGCASMWSDFALGTAMYDYTTAVTLGFSQPWVSVISGVSPSSVTTTGSGLHQESTSIFQISDLPNLTYSQTVQAKGSAGDGLFNVSGKSVTYNGLYTNLIFDFGNTPTDFDITYLAIDVNLDSSTQLTLPFNGTGESVGGSGGTQLLLDGAGGAFYAVGQPNIFYGLTGQHSVRVWTGAEANAIAQYPYVVPESSSLPYVLIGLGIVLMATLQRDRCSAHGTRDGA